VASRSGAGRQQWGQHGLHLGEGTAALVGLRPSAKLKDTDTKVDIADRTVSPAARGDDKLLVHAQQQARGSPSGLGISARSVRFGSGDVNHREAKDRYHNPRKPKGTYLAHKHILR
jgi:hypothetical protein